MEPVSSADVPLVRNDGQLVSRLLISLLPQSDPTSIPPPLVLGDADPFETDALAEVQLLEGHEYRYEIQEFSEPPVLLEPRELFRPDDLSGLTGRLRPGLATGRVRVRCEGEGGVVLCHGALEVRSRKLNYLLHYRWMLRDIAEVMSELVMERFAAAEQRFQVADGGDARTLYQRFAFLRTLLSGDEFEGVLQQILSRPYVSWDEEEYIQSPQAGIPASSQVAREISRPGPSVAAPWLPNGRIPAGFRTVRTEATVDNPPNRFVRYALKSWREVVESVRAALERESQGLQVDRGLTEVDRLLANLDRFLGSELFAEVGDLHHFPAGNQVLQKREGYRELYRAFLQSEIAAKLAWGGGDDVFWAGQRNVAALYEFWTFFQVAQVVSDLCDLPLDLSPLIRMSAGGLGLILVRGEAKSLRGEVRRLGRTLHIHVWYNQTFRRLDSPSGTWTRTMRPDVSLFIESSEDPLFEPVWLHFDAKYRVDSLAEILGTEEEVAEEALTDSSAGGPNPEDLHKMHAYKDAIRRSVGAYVLYPGQHEELLTAYHELLPGLGAFVLRPTEDGRAEGHISLASFIDDVVSHVASQLTQHERERYWVRQSHGGQPPAHPASAASFLEKPPADTEVLLGYVRGPSHLEWIHRELLYNVRAGDRSGAVGLASEELLAELVVLYGRGIEEPEIWSVAGAPLIQTQAAMLSRGYPDPRGELYFCIPLDERLSERLPYPLSSEMVVEAAERHRGDRARFAPVGMSWLDLVAG